MNKDNEFKKAVPPFTWKEHSHHDYCEIFDSEGRYMMQVTYGTSANDLVEYLNLLWKKAKIVDELCDKIPLITEKDDD